MRDTRKLSVAVIVFVTILLLRIGLRLTGVNDTTTVQVLIVATVVVILFVATSFSKWKWLSASQELPSQAFFWLLLAVVTSTVVTDKLVRDLNDIPFFIGIAIMFCAGEWSISTVKRHRRCRNSLQHQP